MYLYTYLFPFLTKIVVLFLHLIVSSSGIVISTTVKNSKSITYSTIVSLSKIKFIAATIYVITTKTASKRNIMTRNRGREGRAE
jgi:hypothetical protein